MGFIMCPAAQGEMRNYGYDPTFSGKWQSDRVATKCNGRFPVNGHHIVKMPLRWLALLVNHYTKVRDEDFSRQSHSVTTT